MRRIFLLSFFLTLSPLFGVWKSSTGDIFLTEEASAASATHLSVTKGSATGPILAQASYTTSEGSVLFQELSISASAGAGELGTLFEYCFKVLKADVIAITLPETDRRLRGLLAFMGFDKEGAPKQKLGFDALCFDKVGSGTMPIKNWRLLRTGVLHAWLTDDASAHP